jgi:hypothetical protein
MLFGKAAEHLLTIQFWAMSHSDMGGRKEARLLLGKIPYTFMCSMGICFEEFLQTIILSNAIRATVVFLSYQITIHFNPFM